jgi:formylglycine-generating enzyme required for sulfatase activity
MAREAITGVKSLGMERPTEMARGIHAGWDDWVRRAVANDAERRFQSAGSMRSGLTFPKAKRSSSPMPLLLLGLAAVFAVVYFVIGNPFAENPNAGEEDAISKGTSPEEDAPDKEKTEKELAGLAPGKSGLRVTIDPPNIPAKIWIAGQAGRGVVGGKKFFEDLDPGSEELIVKASGFQDYSVRLRLEEGWNSHRVGLVALRGGLIVRSDPGVKAVVIGPNGREFDLGVTDRLGTIVSEGILAVGAYEVRLSKPKRVPVSRNVRLVEGKAVTLDEPLVAVPGKLSVTASPAGVVIHLSGVSKGAVPLELSGVPAEKDLDVTARLEGYRELRRTVRLEAAGSQTIDFGSLVKEWGNLVVKLRADLAEDPATKMFLDDADVTAKANRDTPGAFALEELSVGSRAVKITHPNFLPWTGSIAIRDAETTASEAMFEPKDAELRLEVSSDNPELDPLKNFSLSAGGKEQTPEEGAYRLPAEKEIVLELKADDHRSHTETLSFTANEKRLLKIELEEVTLPVEGKDFMVESVAMTMIWVKPGTFLMGSPASEKDRENDETLYTVTLTEGYWLGKYEVTQAEWERVMGSNPSEYKGADRPVEEVSWTAVTSFCDKLTALERSAGRLPAGMAYQLPTEAQWEYACRAGTKTAYAFGDGLTSGQANISGGPGETTAVGKYPANGWGFHDMHGNVWEWCADWYGDYPTGAARDPVGPAAGSIRVYRGGSWNFTADYARSAIRSRNVPAFSFDLLGFRLSLRPADEAEPQVQVPEKPRVAVSVKAGTAFTIRDLGLDMLWVKPGTFEMGSSSGSSDETPHMVTLTQGFYLGKHEVTQAQWEKVIGSNRSRIKGVNLPVTNASWTAVTSFCNKLTASERTAGRLPAGMTYQLPTEAQWEYACRAGTKTAFSFGNSLTSRQANISGGPRKTTDVGSYPANGWGFHDMHGNVWEWCADRYRNYPTGAARDPVGPAIGSSRVERGGSWLSKAFLARSAYRFRLVPASSLYNLGFRLSLRPASK